MVRHEPFWQTNTSFSPPPSRWDFSFTSEDLPYDSSDGNMSCVSSASSSSKEIRSMRAEHLHNNYYSSAYHASLFLRSHSDLSPGPQWTPPEMQEIHAGDRETAKRGAHGMQQLLSSSTPNMEGTTRHLDSGGSTSSCSDSNESEVTFKSWLSSNRNCSGSRPFLSKPVHPLFFWTEASREISETQSAELVKSDAHPLQKDAHRWSSASSSKDFADVSDPFESESIGQLQISCDGFKCGLCKKLLSQRSPWSTQRIVRSGDMPVVGVLSCCHVFHAECLEQTTPKAHKFDPPCPSCVKLEEQSSPNLQVFSRLRNNFPGLRSSSECGVSRPRGFMPMGDYVAGALHAPQQATMLLRNQNRIRNNLSLKCNTSKEFPGKLRKSGTCSSKLLSGKSGDLVVVGCSKTNSVRSMNR